MLICHMSHARFGGAAALFFLVFVVRGFHRVSPPFFLSSLPPSLSLLLPPLSSSFSLLSCVVVSVAVVSVVVVPFRGRPPLLLRLFVAVVS